MSVRSCCKKDMKIKRYLADYLSLFSKVIRVYKYYYELFGLQAVRVMLILAFAPTKMIRISVRVNGCKGFCYLRLSTTDVRVFKQVFINNEYDIDLDITPARIVDLGGNIGLVTLYYLLKYGDVEIDVVEPNPDNYAVLEKNLSLFPSVRMHKKAAVCCNGDYYAHNSDKGYWAAYVDHNPRNGEKVDTINVEKLLSNNGRPADLLKIDVEGSEREYFESNIDWPSLAKAIIVELHEDMSPGVVDSFMKKTTGYPNRIQRGEHWIVWQ